MVLVLLAVLASTSGALVAAVMAAYATYKSQLPDAATVGSMEPALDTHVFDAKGTLIGILGSKDSRHIHVTLDNISQWAKLATIDVEDRHFYEEGSWDLPRLVKAGWDDIRGGQTQGASTITEQLAKISFFNSPERSLDYKIKEIVLGNEIEANFSKDQILEMYLNRVAYGNHAIGIETASQLYFLKPSKQLDLAESAMLAGLPQSPSVYDPLNHDGTLSVNPASTARQRTVLQAMVTNGDISQKQADAAAAEPLTYHAWNEPQSNPNPYPDFMNFLTGWLTDKYGDSFIKPGGWDVTTTLDAADQRQAETSLHDGIAKIRDQHNARDGAVVNIDPRTGKVIALVGTWDYADSDSGQTNMAVRQRSPGSTIKLFTYTAAIASHQFTVDTPILDAPVHLSSGPGQDYSPNDYDRKWHGVCLLKTCLGNSLNVPAVKVEAATGIPYITDLEIGAGLTSFTDPTDRPTPTQYSATLGGLRAGITPLELADAAATIADLGVHHDPVPVDHILDRPTGKTFFTYDAKAGARRVVPENVAFIMVEVTSNDGNRAAEFGAHSDLTLPDRRVSAKTGTSEFFTDNWTVGWTPEVVTAVWVGNPFPSCLRDQDRGHVIAQKIASRPLLYTGETPDDPFSPADLAYYGLQPRNHSCGHLDNSSGITGAAPIWHDDMTHILASVKPDWYPVPKDVIQHGTNDDADFFLPGTTADSGTGLGASGPGCIYWGPAPVAGQTCQYVGTSPPTQGVSPPAAQGETTPSPRPVTPLPPTQAPQGAPVPTLVGRAR